MVTTVVKVDVAGVDAGGWVLNTSLDALPAVLVRVKPAGVATPVAVAVTV